MSSTVEKHLEWGGFFHDENRIEANFQKAHPDYPPHDHRFVEIVVIVGGSCLHRSPLGDQTITKGDAFLFRQGAWHSYINCRKLSVYNCCFHSAMLGDEFMWMADDSLLGRLLWTVPLSKTQYGMVALRLTDSELEQCQHLLDPLCKLSDLNSHLYRADQIGLVTQVLAILARRLPDNNAPAEQSKPHPAVAAALKLIHDNPTEDWSLTTLASRVRLEPTYLVRQFKLLAGMPPMAYLRRRRLELAANLLVRSDKSIGEVGCLVGWPDANYFTRRFRAHFHLTPSVYRTRLSASEVPHHNNGGHSKI